MNPLPVAVDASVALKWVVTAEAFADLAQALYRDCLAAGRRLVGPPHLTGEVTNALYQRVRTQNPDRQLTETEAREALSAFLALGVELLTTPDLYEQAFSFARAHTLPSVYDALYVVFAQTLGTELWTADQRLLAALDGAAPWVRFIGDYPR
jgi:predicted nucleic acid-binding protein